MRNLESSGFTPHRKNCWRRYCSTRLIRGISHRCISKMPYRRASQNNFAVLLRLAMIFAAVAVTIHARDDVQANHELLTLTLPQGWLTQHPLGKEIIAQESQWQSYVHWPLEVH
ncbi:hypothetical protein ACLK1T_11955 [Escherichia coli]